MRDFDYSELQAQLAKKPTIVITTHRGPDGDAMGSSLALYQVLYQANISIFFNDVKSHSGQELSFYNIIALFCTDNRRNLFA
jgi:nanoRNase/pAp phosphatase (c-di-AMP/oligoRNAs hydrolase)